MSHRYVVTGATCAALLGLAYAHPVKAADLETNAVWNNLRPNLTPPFSKQKPAKTAKSQKQKKQHEARKSESSKNRSSSYR